MKKLTLLLALLTFITASVNSQTVKKNAFGKKMIKSIMIDHLSKDGEINPDSWNTTYTMEYFPDRSLKSIERSWKYGRNRYTQKYCFDEEGFHYEATTNGEKLENVKFVAGTPTYKNKEKKVDPYLESTTITVKDIDGGFPVYLRTTRFYKVNEANLVEIEMIADDSVEKEVAYIAEDPHRIAHYSSSRGYSSVFPHTDFRKAGYKGVSLVAEGDDGLLYRLDKTIEKRKVLIGSNYYSDIGDPASRTPRGDKFLKRINDTNINLAGIMEYDYFEMITEWVHLWRSGCLINVEEQRGANRWTRKWDYHFDENDNIQEILVDWRMQPDPNYIVKINYEKEDE